jgi:circadian clock protein KaiC
MVRRAVSVIKKRTGKHEETIREYKITDDGLTLGQPLTGFQGILRGVPTLVNDSKPLLLQNEREDGDHS